MIQLEQFNIRISDTQKARIWTKISHSDCVNLSLSRKIFEHTLSWLKTLFLESLTWWNYQKPYFNLFFFQSDSYENLHDITWSVRPLVRRQRAQFRRIDWSAGEWLAREDFLKFWLVTNDLQHLDFDTTHHRYWSNQMMNQCKITFRCCSPLKSLVFIAKYISRDTYFHQKCIFLHIFSSTNLN